MMAKTRVIELFLDNTFEDKKVPFEVNKLKPTKKKEVKFEPICVFKQRKKRGRFSWFRKEKSLILYVNGAYQALRFGKVTSTLQPLWTKEEAERFVKKQVAKSLEEYKPMTWSQFIIILVPVALSLFILLKIALHLRAF